MCYPVFRGGQHGCLSPWDIPRKSLRHPGLIDGFFLGPSFQGILTSCCRRMARFSELSVVTWVTKDNISVWPSAQLASKPRTFSSAFTVSPVPSSPICSRSFFPCLLLLPRRESKAETGPEGQYQEPRAYGPLSPQTTNFTHSLLLMCVELTLTWEHQIRQVSISSVSGKPVSAASVERTGKTNTPRAGAGLCGGIPSPGCRKPQVL